MLMYFLNYQFHRPLLQIISHSYRLIILSPHFVYLTLKDALCLVILQSVMNNIFSCYKCYPFTPGPGIQ